MLTGNTILMASIRCSGIWTSSHGHTRPRGWTLRHPRQGREGGLYGEKGQVTPLVPITFHGNGEYLLFIPCCHLWFRISNGWLSNPFDPVNYSSTSWSNAIIENNEGAPFETRYRGHFYQTSFIDSRTIPG